MPDDPYEVDPYGEAMSHIVEALNNALDDGVSHAMSEREYDILEKIGFLINYEDPMTGDRISPRAA